MYKRPRMPNGGKSWVKPINGDNPAFSAIFQTAIIGKIDREKMKASIKSSAGPTPNIIKTLPGNHKWQYSLNH
jgi:hypothetical protein